MVRIYSIYVTAGMVGSNGNDVSSLLQPIQLETDDLVPCRSNPTGTDKLYPNDERLKSDTDCLGTFVYEGVQITGCTYLDGSVPWCLTKDCNGDGDKTWQMPCAKYAICEKGQYKTCGLEERPAQPTRVRDKRELRKACLERIDYCLLQTARFEHYGPYRPRGRIRDSMKSFCQIAYPTAGDAGDIERETCEDSVEDFADAIDFTGQVSPMGGFCDKIGNLENMADYPLELTLDVTLALMEGANTQDEQRLLQRRASSAEIHAGHVDNLAKTTVSFMNSEC